MYQFIKTNKEKKHFHTSDCQRGRGLQFSHSVFCHTGERALVVDRGLLHPQHVVVFLEFNLIPVDKGATRQHLMQNKTNNRCLCVSPEPVECISPPLRDTKKHDCPFWQMDGVLKRINYLTMTHRQMHSTETLQTSSIFMRGFSCHGEMCTNNIQSFCVYKCTIVYPLAMPE